MRQLKLKHIEEGIAFSGRRAKTARSQGKKVQITVEQEISKILGNLAWAYLQQNNYSSAKKQCRNRVKTLDTYIGIMVFTPTKGGCSSVLSSISINKHRLSVILWPSNLLDLIISINYS
ncbi:uncharacterized protein LOC115988418 isoform X2 [Quercus lobata]|uniref:uncharacterized protein LOC115988418 isoform X2 n=1 Tax=Quercus lobata TaxID=97700 RepID=UPI001243F367|nr:uncharacterized protein LOC115988418 isoform X2 [Quercus lobata]